MEKNKRQKILGNLLDKLSKASKLYMNETVI